MGAARTSRAADVLEQQCPRAVFDRVTNRWAVLIFSALADGPRRFSELTAEVAGISEKMLSQNLKILVRAGLIERSVAPTVPPQVTYSLTALGSDLAVTLHTLVHWVDDHTGTMVQARDRHDAGRS
ncbi:helix-turn-helix domain-containing protein [Actinoallomurus sp. NPDC052308]|uniref:winged helix-turn-helix transcriptional regulator n=1 Tax=Actinoallomurus sp. NPDC052308 TaxID=3155530 RepID=UPI003447F7D4